MINGYLTENVSSPRTWNWTIWSRNLFPRLDKVTYLGANEIALALISNRIINHVTYISFKFTYQKLPPEREKRMQVGTDKYNSWYKR